LRSGEIWVRGSRRYADPASYLIAIETWQPGERRSWSSRRCRPPSPNGSRPSTRR
jgi:hypothetical protein